jgi:glycosyltransferase involved in cell wall biosynthesis
MESHITENESPKISVIMPTKNAEMYLKESITSILSQSYGDFEFLIIDDHSTDHTLELINGFKDSRIKLIDGDCRGISAALNLGINLAKGEYIARMDADDISLPDRFKEQVFFLDQNSDIGICGTRVIPISNDSRFDAEWGNWLKTEPKIIDLFGPVIVCHPTVMMRKSVIERFDLYYDETIRYTEDQDLWFRAIKVTKFYNLGNKLLKYRIHNESSTIKNEVAANLILQGLKEDLSKWLGFEDHCAETEQEKVASDLAALVKLEEYKQIMRLLSHSRWIKLGRKIGFLKQIKFVA